MMGAAMLKCHRFVQSLWALYRLVVSSITLAEMCTQGSQAQPLFYTKSIPGTVTFQLEICMKIP